MKKSFMNAAFAATTLAIGLLGAAADASAACGSTGQNTCPPVPDPIITPSPSPSPSTVNNGGGGGSAASQAAANAAAQAAANLKTGDIGSTSSAKIGDVAVGGNNSSYSSNYKTAVSSAFSGGSGNSGHDCFKGEGAFGAAVQTWGFGTSVHYGGGEVYEMKEMTFTNPDGTTRIALRNPCASDKAVFLQMQKAQSPYATKGEKQVALAAAMEMSPVVDTAVRKVLSGDVNLGELFDQGSPQNNYVTTIADKTGATTTFSCPKGTKMVVNSNGQALINPQTGLPTCQPG